MPGAEAELKLSVPRLKIRAQTVRTDPTGGEKGGAFGFPNMESQKH